MMIYVLEQKREKKNPYTPVNPSFTIKVRCKRENNTRKCLHDGMAWQNVLHIYPTK